MEYEKDERAQLKNFPTAKELREAKEKAEARLKREHDEAMKIGLTVCSLYFITLYACLEAYNPSARNEKRPNIMGSDLQRFASHFVRSNRRIYVLNIEEGDR